MLIRIGQHYFNPDHVAAVRPVDGGDRTAIFTSASSPVDGGFLVDVPTDEVVEILQMADISAMEQMIRKEAEGLEEG